MIQDIPPGTIVISLIDKIDKSAPKKIKNKIEIFQYNCKKGDELEIISGGEEWKGIALCKKKGDVSQFAGDKLFHINNKDFKFKQ